jgi:hypothetical protein
LGGADRTAGGDRDARRADRKLRGCPTTGEQIQEVLRDAVRTRTGPAAQRQSLHQHGEREQGERVAVEQAAEALAVGAVLDPAARARLEVRVRAPREYGAIGFAGRQRLDRVGAVAAESAGGVQQREAFAFALARAGRGPNVVAGGPEGVRGAAPAVPFSE